jgi:required for meiotic nuclear division protein 1
MEALSFCIANTIDLNKLENSLNEDNCFSVSRMRNVIQFRDVMSVNRLGFIFTNGTLITWGYKRHNIMPILNAIKPACNDYLRFYVHDEFCYYLDKKTAIKPHDYFDVDFLSLENESDELKLSLSYGFSQSIKLQYFESRLEMLIDKYTPYISDMSTKGLMRISRRQIRKIIGEILQAKSEMNLVSNFLYHPKFFWKHTSYETYFSMLEDYLDMARRVNTINHRLDTLNEIFDMFSDYLENKHSHSLEIIIIVLIGIEIIIALLNIHL